MAQDNTEFNAKKIFSKFRFLRGDSPKYRLRFLSAISREFRNFRSQNVVFLDQFLTLKNMAKKFFQNSNFSDFLGIKSEISQAS